MRNRALWVTVIVVAAVVASAVVVGLATTQPVAGPHHHDETFAGDYTSDTDLRVASLGIPGGHVSAGYSVDVLFLPAEAGSGIRCGIVDTSGSVDLFEASRTNAGPGVWTTLSFDGRYVFPAMTLGLRCSPDRSGPATIVFRDAELHATAVPAPVG